ncbi:MAG: hypothetical protein KKG59_01630 [Nanoarchaeota archaeon]|nr:hypothetical protein [Nanoarchaeota archaeon]
MKIGVKIHPDNKEYIQQIKPHVDFFEIIAIQGKSYGFLNRINIPLVIHAEDFKYKTNLANPANNDISAVYLRFAFDLLKEHKAEHLVLNPGVRFNNKCTSDNHAKIFHKFGYKKVLIENQPPLKNRTYPFYARNYDEMRQFLKKTKAGFCLDLDHAYASAFFFNRDPVDFIKDMLDLKPKHIHISNGRSQSYIDAHLHFAEGDFNMLQMKELIPNDVWVTIDTNSDLNEQLEEIKFLREPEYSK